MHKRKLGKSNLVWCPGQFFTTAYFVENNVSSGSPGERPGGFVPIGEPFINGAFQLLNTVKGTTTDHAFGDQSKPALYLIEPRTAGGGEMEVKRCRFLAFSHRWTASLL